MTVFEQLYGTVTGELLPDYAVPGVENAFRPGSLCDRESQNIWEARERICERLGVTEEDPDMEILFNSFLAIQNELAQIMFELGTRWGKSSEPK